LAHSRRTCRVLAASAAAKHKPTFQSGSNTIREVASFQSQLRREAEEIRERIAVINQSLHQIDYARGRYILPEEQTTADPEVRDFQQDLRVCTDSTLTGSDDAGYSEAKFLQVKQIIERARGRHRVRQTLDPQGHRCAGLVRVLSLRALALRRQ